jgi:hypothetical protein
VATVGDGADLSIVIVTAADVVALPAESVSVTEILHVPSANCGRSHVFVEIVQETLVEPLVAVTTAVPEKVPETLILGVSSEVMLSVAELPESDAASRSGVVGVATVVLLITNPVSVAALEITLLNV